MNLAILGSLRQRTSFVMRLGCCLLCISLLLGLACPLRAHAVVTESVVIALVAAYLASCGYSLAAHDMNASGTSGAMAKMIQNFLGTELGGVSISQWAEAWYTTGIMIQGGVAYLPAPAANALAQFANWAKGEYGDTPGTEAVVFSTHGFTAADGKYYAFTVAVADDPSATWAKCSNFQVGTTIVTPVPASDFPDKLTIPVFAGFSIVFHANGTSVFYDYARQFFSFYGSGDDYLNVSNLSFFINPAGTLTVGYVRYSDGIPYYYYSSYDYGPKLSDLNITGGSLTMGVLQGLTLPRELVDGETLKLNLGNPAIDTPDALTDSVIGGIQAGDLTAEAEIVDAVDVPIDPPVEPTAPDIDGLGLPALGAALVSRFPFSIPWDVAKGVQLLAAPPKAPYWEVDFLAPISYRVGGWQGDTTFVIDMSEFEIIGQLSRWTSTIGFCLLLASGTKRLIWTA